MQILDIIAGKYPQFLERAGVAIKVTNQPYMDLSVESIGARGPWGEGIAVSICHYGEQNGDLMRDPEVCLERTAAGGWRPYYYRNDYVGFEQESCEPGLVAALETFCRTWDANLRSQGFVTAVEADKAQVRG
jgi:hypothetical protein